jgi:hypothetical protein
MTLYGYSLTQYVVLTSLVVSTSGADRVGAQSILLEMCEAQTLYGLVIERSEKAIRAG